MRDLADVPISSMKIESKRSIGGCVILSLFSDIAEDSPSIYIHMQCAYLRIHLLLQAHCITNQKAGVYSNKSL